MERLALVTLLAILAVPGTALAAPVKISPRPASVSAAGVATVEVANPNRYALRGTAFVAAGARTVASRRVRLPKLAVTGLKLRFDRQDLSALRAANGRAMIKLALRRTGGRKTTARRTVTLRMAGGGQPPAPAAPGAPAAGQPTPSQGGTPGSPAPASDRWVGRMGTEGAYDDLEFTLSDGQIQFTKPPLVPVYCFEMGGQYRTAVSLEPFVVSGPWALGSDGSVQQSGIAVNQLVSGGSRGITYTLKDSARSAGSVTGTLGMSYFDSKYDLFANKIWFVNCSGAESFEAVPAG